MTQSAAELIVRKTVTVATSQDRAFAVFTAGIGTWWPLADKSIGAGKPETAVLEPRAGGRWYERAVDGIECEWGRVVAFEPPRRLVLDWQISAQWRFDPSIHSEIEVRFIAVGANETRVELEHRGLLAAYGDGAAQMHAIFDSPGGWPEILDGYARAAGGPGTARHEVRVATTADAATFGRLLHAFNVEFDEVTPDPDTIAARAVPMLDNGEIVVLFAGEGPDGFAQLRFRPSLYTGTRDVTLDELYVVPERRGEGIGRALLNASLDVARARGARHVELNTSEDDTAARGLYESSGFTNLEGPKGARMLYYERDL